MYIHEHSDWTDFRWNNDKIALILDDVSREQGKLYGRLANLGFEEQIRAMGENIALDVVYSSEIEGIKFNVDEVRSSVAKKLGIDNVKQTHSSHFVDSIVSVMLDAIEHYNRPITKDNLCAWQAAFFPAGYSEGNKIEIGIYRTNEEHVVSGTFGREKVHFIAPVPELVEKEMEHFIDWFNQDKPISSIIRSAIAHFWFVTIHPFEDGNGRLARILGDVFLAKGEKSKLRFYNISSEINRDKKHYYEILEKTQKGDGDITEWLVWYLQTLYNAIQNANVLVNTILNKSLFWVRIAGVPLSERQTNTINQFLDGYEAKITSKKWAEMNNCSSDTANRDIKDLIEKGILCEDIPGAKRPSYSIVYVPLEDDITQHFSNIKIQYEESGVYLIALFEGRKQIHERILKLDAERYNRGDLPVANLLNKYCSYLMN